MKAITDKIVELHLAGTRKPDIVRRLGVTKGQVAGAIHRINNPDLRFRKKAELKGDRWTDEKLTEPWADYRARRQAEREMRV